ncbi:hypothetical protein DP116_07255 [Brasilonema bromeliae SPC951]|uniref:Uncharacterized protein n=2 Tax=Bromeliae group (in: Brasilonema) TaxID=3398495 RepID=A0ABX1P4G3_9CYAN|nr:hypothetical protein [Brasilonema bromeliae]NMG19260.1 hypothetical protein [Brasilonema bromeliae SPC951]
MDVSSRYWKIYRISTSQRVGYEHCLVPPAQEFLKQVRNLVPTNTQAVLLSYFVDQNSAVDVTTRAKAGLCLRSYVSEPILRACQKIDSLFSGDNFTYQDLLTYVLDDDGKTLVIVDGDGKTQLIVDNNGETRTTDYKFFSVRILQKFNADLESKMSLDNWAYFQTTQNPELKNYLAEFGFKHLSDWALLNRVRAKQFERLSKRDRHLVEVFHAVYRRDRLQKHSRGVRKCPEPSSTQLQEMLNGLRKRDVMINSTVELMNELKQVVTQLRHYDIWSYREPLEVQDPNTGGYTFRTDLPADNLNEVDIEEQEILDFLHEQLSLALKNAIEQEIGDRIKILKKSKNYAVFAQQFLPGLQFYYCQSLSLKDIAPKLEMTSWDQARRVLNPGELLSKVRTTTVKQLLDSILKKAEEKHLTKNPPEPDYLKTLAEYIEAFADDEIFREAAEEIRVGKNRSMNSFYARQLCKYIEQRTQNLRTCPPAVLLKWG